MFEAPNELKKPLVCTNDKSNVDEPREYPSHTIQYTMNKPTLKFCENPKCATLHFINRVQLLDSVPDDVGVMIKRFWSTIRPKRWVRICSGHFGIILSMWRSYSLSYFIYFKFSLSYKSIRWFLKQKFKIYYFCQSGLYNPKKSVVVLSVVH